MITPLKIKKKWIQIQSFIVVIVTIIISGIFKKYGFIPFMLSFGLCAGCGFWVFKILEHSRFIELTDV